MKIARFFAYLFGLIGAALMAGTILLCLFSLNAPVKMKAVPEEALACAQEMLDALAAGDFSAASAKMYGQPNLGMDGQPREELGQLVWNAFTQSISCEFTGECYVKDDRICRDASITMLEIPSITEGWSNRVHTLLTARIQAAEEQGTLLELYDENNNFRADLVNQVIREAVEAAIREDGRKTTKHITLQMVCQDGTWWVVPDEALLTRLSGGLA